MKKLLLVTFAVLLSTGCTKMYKPDANLPKNQSAYIKIDGSKSKKNKLLTMRTTTVNLSHYLGDCKWKDLGSIYVIGDKSSKTLAIKAGVPTRFMSTKTTAKGNYTENEYSVDMLKPRVGYTYTIQFDDAGKGNKSNAFAGQSELSIFETYRGRTRPARGVYAEPRCSK